MDPIIKLKDISVVYSFGKSNENWALRKVSAEIFSEQFIIFFGPSGCGKSTLLNVIAGLESPLSGSTEVNNRELSSMDEKEKTKFHRESVGIIFQAFYLLPELSVKDNISLPLIFCGKTNYEAKVRSLTNRFGLEELALRYPNQLSGGQQQRVAIARALINDPPIILADEPVGNLDSKNSDIVMDLISDLNKKYHKTIILVTHNPKHLHLADKVFYIEDGKITKIASKTQKNKEDAESELDKLSFTFPYVSKPELKAKLIFNHLFVPGDLNSRQNIETSIQKYVKKNISYTDLETILNQKESEGGIGFYSQTAKKIAKKIKKMVEEMKLFEEILETEDEISIHSKIAMLRQGILSKFPQIHLTPEQMIKLDNILINRIEDKIKDKNLFNFLDRSVKKNGLGLNSRTARKIMKELKIFIK